MPASNVPHHVSSEPIAPHSPAARGDGATGLEDRIREIGGDLLYSMRNVVQLASEGQTARPQHLARRLGVDKVLTSRVLKAIRGSDPIQAAHRMPGPDPLRRLVRGAARRGVASDATEAALAAIDRFESLIEGQVGDRSLLDAILSAWVPDARREFELRRKQAAFKAMSQLRGVQASAAVASVVVWPNEDGVTNDVIWINGLLGVHRVRPGATVRVTTRRMPSTHVGDDARRAMTLDGRRISALEERDAANAMLIPEFCSVPTPTLSLRTLGQSIFYTLAGEDFGAGSATDVIFAEVNRAELPRFVPAGSGRRSYFFADIATPCEGLQFDLFLHEDLYPAQAPELRVYDTSFEGSASPNDPARDPDLLDLLEGIEPLGTGFARARSSDVDRYADLLRHVIERAGMRGERLRGFRCRSDYPIYGTQMTMVLRGVEK
jgi:hypothetical protein